MSVKIYLVSLKYISLIGSLIIIIDPYDPPPFHPIIKCNWTELKYVQNATFLFDMMLMI